MIILQEELNDRKIIYLEIRDNLNELYTLNLSNWVVFVIEDNIKNPILNSFAEMCIDKNVLYMHATGKVCKEIDDLFDWKMIIRQQTGGKIPFWMKSEDDILMTAWDEDFDDAFYFITYAANYEDHAINTVVVANLTTTDYLPQIKNLVEKLKTKIVIKATNFTNAHEKSIRVNSCNLWQFIFRGVMGNSFAIDSENRIVIIFEE